MGGTHQEPGIKDEVRGQLQLHHPITPASYSPLSTEPPSLPFGEDKTTIFRFSLRPASAFKSIQIIMTYAMVTFTNTSGVRYKIDIPSIKFSATVNGNGGQASTSEMEVNTRYNVKVGVDRGTMREIT
jgi:hypothetical protein